MDSNGTPEPKDYGFCETDKESFDLWKYDYDLAAAGHDLTTCHVREPTPEEYQELLKDCKESGCY